MKAQSLVYPKFLSPLIVGTCLIGLLSATAQAETRVTAWVAINQYSGAASAWPSFWSDNFDTDNDVILGMAPSSATGNFAPYGNMSSGAINDGILTQIPTTNTDVSMFAGVGPDSGAGTQMIFDLNQPTYVSSISYFGGWTDGGRGSAALTISYSTDNGATWTALLDEVDGGTYYVADSNLSPIAGNEDLATTFSRKMAGSGGPMSNYINVYDDSSLYLAGGTAITNVKFDFGTVYNGWVGVEELVVTGVSAVPEPSTWGLCLITGILAMCTVRHRRRA